MACCARRHGPTGPLCLATEDRITTPALNETKKIIKVVRDLSRPFRITKGRDFRLKDVDPNDTLEFTKEEDKPRAKDALAMGVMAVSDLQEKLYAQWS